MGDCGRLREIVCRGLGDKLGENGLDGGGEVARGLRVKY